MNFSLFFYFLYESTRKFKTAQVACIIFLLDSVALDQL